MIVISNFLTPEIITIVDNIKKNFNSKETKMLGWTNAIWDENLYRSSALTFVVPVPELDNYLQPLFEKADPIFKNARIDTQFCLWGKGSTIPFHNDSHVAFAATVYLNEKWDVEDGGLFLWRDSNTGELLVVSPEYNVCVINNLRELHHVSVVSYGAKQFRMTLQIWAHVKDDTKDVPPEANTFIYE
jgi:Rps23 Pro-64 3,4-dihydroxylase Tpa1-like proline 4-hydroxylase